MIGRSAVATAVAVSLWAAPAGATGAAPSIPVSPRVSELPPVVGDPLVDVVRENDTLLDVAFRHRVGFDAVRRLNPDLDVWVPQPGARVELPTRWILPDGPREGLVINVPEMRLYDFTVGPVPEVFAIAVGDYDDRTPEGSFVVRGKRIDPGWNVPESIRLERPELPAFVPPGDANPLGDRWMTLGTSSYGIHGTNNRWSIGRLATHGCVRLYADEMRRLFSRIPEGTRARIVYQPIKLGRAGPDLFLESHPDVYANVANPASSTLVYLFALGLYDAVDREAVKRAVTEARGTPVRIGSIPATD